MFIGRPTVDWFILILKLLAILHVLLGAALHISGEYSARKHDADVERGHWLGLWLPIVLALLAVLIGVFVPRNRAGRLGTNFRLQFVQIWNVIALTLMLWLLMDDAFRRHVLKTACNKLKPEEDTDCGRRYYDMQIAGAVLTIMALVVMITVNLLSRPADEDLDREVNVPYNLVGET
jgi:hypothetical protein